MAEREKLNYMLEAKEFFQADDMCLLTTQVSKINIKKSQPSEGWREREREFFFQKGRFYPVLVRTKHSNILNYKLNCYNESAFKCWSHKLPLSGRKRSVIYRSARTAAETSALSDILTP